MSTCLLLAPSHHRLFPAAAEMCRQAFDSVKRPCNGEILSTPHDILISFLNDHILPPECLRRPNVNFHPAPPQYPGRGGASYALYDGADSYGATAHIMAAAVDAGPILRTRQFPIERADTCETVFAKAEDACLSLLAEVLWYYNAIGVLPEPCGEAWSGPARTRKQFERWLILDPADPESFARKIKAARHSKFPGPYVEHHGFRFSLHQEVQ